MTRASKLTGEQFHPNKHFNSPIADSLKESSVKPKIKLISADGDSKADHYVSVKSITIPSIGKHHYAHFVTGNHHWEQKCMIDPGSNINCVGYDWNLDNQI